jgi:phosphoglycolate phosphatase-like HAD superfamily hydrolase
MRGLLLMLFVAFAISVACSSNDPAPKERPTTTSAAPKPNAADLEKLVGRWLRNDMSYMIEIASAATDGKLEARYLNPQPIHVSKAEAKPVNGALEVLVELTDRGYPGSFYTLTYAPGEDLLRGVYHHLGLQQNFDVVFFRFKEEAPR